MWYHIEKNIKTRVLKRWTRHRREELSPEVVEQKDIQQILIVRQHDQFGDFLLTTPAIRAVRLKFPDAFIVLIVRDYLEPIALHNPDVDEICVFYDSANKWTPSRILSFIRTLRRPFDLAIVFNTVSHSLSSDLIAYYSGASFVLGPEYPKFDHIDQNPFYTLISPVDRTPTHQTERNLDIVRYIGADAKDTSYRYGITDLELVEGQRIKSDTGASDGVRVLAVHFGTDDIKKRYPIDKLAEVCNYISDMKSLIITVIPAPGEEDLLEDLKARCGGNIIVLPPVTLRQAAAYLKKVDLLLCNDTGILHLAAAVQTPTVSCHAVSDPAVWKPPGSRHLALYAVNGQIDTIPIEMVIDTVRTGLEEFEVQRDAIIPC